MDSMRSLLSTSDFLQVREHKLSNDLTVWLNEDHSQPKIFGAVVVKAGAKDSPNTGIAHYFEHMMFKGTDKIGTIDYESESCWTLSPRNMTLWRIPRIPRCVPICSKSLTT